MPKKKVYGRCCKCGKRVLAEIPMCEECYYEEREGTGV